jgi:ABC-type transport system involved in multi-copper enzyme maturation permease subunit
MTFAALLTKELRLRLRRERSVWVIIVYLVVMGLLGFGYLAQASAFNGNSNYLLSQIGAQLYDLLAVVQLFLVVFIAPAFTATSINGEKERQTFDMLVCSRLSSFSLLAGKLVAGLASTFLLIAASLPLFSLVFFFGGVSPSQILNALVVFVFTAIPIGAFGLFCSTFLRRPTVSTAITYMGCVLWMLGPWVALLLLRGQFLFGIGSGPVPHLLGWNPIAALVSTLPGGSVIVNYTVGSKTFQLWIVYSVISVVMTIVFFLLSMWFVKPNPVGRLKFALGKIHRQSRPVSEEDTVSA